MKQRNWVDKSAKNSYQDNTTLDKKILPKMLFKILKGDFSHKTLFVFLSTFFCRSKEAIETDRLKLPGSAIFSGVKGSLGCWRNRVARPSCLDAILVFLLKTTSFQLWPAEAIVMSIQPYQLEAEYSSSEEAEEDSEDSEGRSFVMWIIEHWKTPDGFFLVCL